MRKSIVLAVILEACVQAVVTSMGARSGSSRVAEEETLSQVCVVWPSGDLGVAKNVCIMANRLVERVA
jgi:hypothetical protein